MPCSPHPSPSTGDQEEAKSWTCQLTTLLATGSKSFLEGRSAGTSLCLPLSSSQQIFTEHLLGARLWGCAVSKSDQALPWGPSSLAHLPARTWLCAQIPYSGVRVATCQDQSRPIGQHMRGTCTHAESRGSRRVGKIFKEAAASGER